MLYNNSLPNCAFTSIGVKRNHKQKEIVKGGFCAIQKTVKIHEYFLLPRHGICIEQSIEPPCHSKKNMLKVCKRES